MGKRVKDIFQPMSTRVIRVLLTRPRDRWRVLTLAKEAQVSLGWTHAVVTTLQEQRYVVRDENYRVKTVDPTRLLKRWAAFHDFLSQNEYKTFQMFEQNLDNVLNKLRSVSAPYALTGLVAAWLVAPSVRPVTFDIYVQSWPEAGKITKAMELRPVEKGGNVRLVLPKDSGVFYGAKVFDSVKIVSNVQLYVDLVNYPARGEEASVELLRLIQEDWSKALTE